MKGTLQVYKKGKLVQVYGKKKRPRVLHWWKAIYVRGSEAGEKQKGAYKLVIKRIIINNQSWGRHVRISMVRGMGYTKGTRH